MTMDNDAIKCTKVRKCGWKGLHSELSRKPSGRDGVTDLVCPKCGHDEYYVMTPVERAKWGAEQQVKQAAAMVDPVERMLPVKNEWAAMDRALNGLIGDVELEIDGYHVALQRRMISANSLGMIVYVNKQIQGSWMVCDDDKPATEEGRRFYQLKGRGIYSAAKIAKAEKDWGKRDAKKLGFYLKVYRCDPVWKSFSALKKHLMANNNNIRVVSIDGAAYE